MWSEAFAFKQSVLTKNAERSSGDFIFFLTPTKKTFETFLFFPHRFPTDNAQINRIAVIRETKSVYG